ncbi:hypothetical protein PGT21_014321 [Puccinia graminis f. sp. tritici]|uniref:Uncharacterized protein n=1 Tax=Puccinia graminis f. sp. tritici TaxID=56615 RepID=A0A5B0Q5C4_PUCGR|nr:hypothetical protein PGT21_014321 [Puccinia graminis f. sp. tritici]
MPHMQFKLSTRGVSAPPSTRFAIPIRHRTQQGQTLSIGSTQTYPTIVRVHLTEPQSLGDYSIKIYSRSSAFLWQGTPEPRVAHVFPGEDLVPESIRCGAFNNEKSVPANQGQKIVSPTRVDNRPMALSKPHGQVKRIGRHPAAGRPPVSL